MGTGWERDTGATSGWEYVDCTVIRPVSLLHNYEWSTFGAVVLGWQGWLGKALPSLGLVCRKCSRAVGLLGKGMGRTSL